MSTKQILRLITWAVLVAVCLVIGPTAVTLSAMAGFDLPFRAALLVGISPDRFTYNGVSTLAGYAASNGKNPLALLAVRHGADPSDPYVIAALRGNLALMKAIEPYLGSGPPGRMSRIDVMQRSLIVAAQQRKNDICGHLIEQGMDVDYYDGDMKTTAINACLHMMSGGDTCRPEGVATFRTLMKSAPNLDVVDGYGTTARQLLRREDECMRSLRSTTKVPE